MKFSNKKDYYKAGQSYRDVVFVVLMDISVVFLLCAPFFWIEMGLSVSSKTILIVIFVSLISCVVYDDIIRFSHHKKIIVSKGGILIIEKRKKNICKFYYSWDSISHIEYLYCRDVKSVFNLLRINTVLYSTSMKGPKKEEKMIVLNLKDFFSFFEQYSLIHTFEWVQVTLLGNKGPSNYSNGYDKDIHVVLSNVCKVQHIEYSLNLGTQ